MNEMSLRRASASGLIAYADEIPPSLEQMTRDGQAEDHRIRANELVMHRTAKTVLIGRLNQAHRLALAVDAHKLKGKRFEAFAAGIGIDRSSAYELYKLDAYRDPMLTHCEKEDHWPSWKSALSWFRPPSPSNADVVPAVAAEIAAPRLASITTTQCARRSLRVFKVRSGSAV